MFWADLVKRKYKKIEKENGAPQDHKKTLAVIIWPISIFCQKYINDVERSFSLSLSLMSWVQSHKSLQNKKVLIYNSGLTLLACSIDLSHQWTALYYIHTAAQHLNRKYAIVVSQRHIMHPHITGYKTSVA